jgi:hypothetical protein
MSSFMANQPTTIPFFSGNPEDQANFLQLQQRQALAQALLQQGMTPISTEGRNYRISPVEGLAKMFQAYIGRKTMDDALAKQGELQAKQYASILNAMGGGQSQQPAADQGQAMPAPQADAASQALGLGASNGSVGPTNSNAALMASMLRGDGSAPQQAPTQAPPQMQAPQAPQGPRATPMNPGGLDPSLATMAFSMNPSGYMETLLQQSAPTEMVKTMRAAGIDPGSPQGQAMLREQVAKMNYIAPTAVRPGGGVMDPRSGHITTMPSAPPDGFQNVQQGDGSFAVVPVQGGTQAQMYSKFYGKLPEALLNVVEGFDPNTKAPVKNYAGNVLRTPQLPVPAPFTGPGGDAQAPAPVQAAPTGSGGVQPGRVGSPEASAQGYGSDSLAILQAERAKTTNPDDLAAIDREIAGVKSKMSRRDLIAAGVEGAPAAPLSKTTVPAPQSSRRDAITAAMDAPKPAGGGFQSGPPLGLAKAAELSQQELSDNWKSQQQAQQQAQTNVALLNTIKTLAPNAAIGYGDAKRQYLAKLGAYAGIPEMNQEATDTDLYKKYSSQLIQSLAAKVGDTDKARELVEAGSPNTGMTPDAAIEAANFLLAREQTALARTEALRPYALKRDPTGYQGTATSFDAVMDPRLMLLRNMGQSQQSAFLGRLDPQDAATLLNNYRAAKKAGFLK